MFFCASVIIYGFFSFIYFGYFIHLFLSMLKTVMLNLCLLISALISFMDCLFFPYQYIFLPFASVFFSVFHSFFLLINELIIFLRIEPRFSVLSYIHPQSFLLLQQIFTQVAKLPRLDLN